MRTVAKRQDDRTYGIGISDRLRGRWCFVTLQLPNQATPIWARLRTRIGAENAIFGETFLRPSTPGRIRRRSGVMFVPAAARELRVDLIGSTHQLEILPLWLRPISRAVAAAVLAMRDPARLAAILRGGHSGLGRRVRAGIAGMATGAPPVSYPTWIGLFDAWEEGRLARLLGSPERSHWPMIAACVSTAAAGNATQPALRATERSLDEQLLTTPYRRIGRGDGAVTLAAALAELDGEYIALLQAGEVLPPHAVALLADQAARLGRPDIIYADEDELSPTGERRAPHFKPAPNHPLMLSGTLSRGIWLVRRDLIAASTGHATQWAETLRLDLWLRRYEVDGAYATHRIPYILTHRRFSADAAPPEALAEVVTAHLSRMSLPACVEPAWPLRVRIIAPPDRQPKVSIVVPSACRAPHVRSCLAAILAKTHYTNFELVVAVSQDGPLDDRQRATLKHLGNDPRVRHILLQRDSFNYAAVNNTAVAATDSPLVCLLNDDVEPMDPLWLAKLVGHLADPRVGAVGARLCYPGGLVQHVGIIMGLAGLCEHTNRFLPAAEPGYAWRAVLDQELSAVTGACLLVRRFLYDTVGGLDESYSSAFNDVDFCLKIRKSGYAVVLVATTELLHYESLSFGSHYARDDSERQLQDVRRMLRQWPDICVDDPFYNPNLSLQRGADWTLAFPPRIDKPLD